VVFSLPGLLWGCHSSGVENAPTSAALPPWTVFVLRNPAGRIFVGHIDDVPRLLATADSDVAKWTGQPGPWPLVWRHDGLTEDAARNYETSLKRDKGTPRFYSRTGLTPPEPVEGSVPPVS